MERVLDKKAAARALAAPAPMKKKPKKLASTITQSRNTTLTPSTLSKKRKATIIDQDNQESDDTPEHDLDFLSLLSPSLATTVSKKSKKSNSSTSQHALPSTFTSKSPVATKPRTGPEVVVFDASKVDRKTSASAGGTEFNFKKFMSSKISKLDEVPPPQEQPLTAEDKAEELENKKNDAELHSLIKTSRLLEQYNADHLDGAERRRHQRDQLVSLGIQVWPFPLSGTPTLRFVWRYPNINVETNTFRKRKRSRFHFKSASE